MTRFVTVRKAAELTGYTEGAIYSKRSEKVWREGHVLVTAPDTRSRPDHRERKHENGRLVEDGCDKAWK